ncbi:NAD-dependent malic enzyme [Saccharibacillus sp. CPCC 101409]|uniref:NAD-dependent malic enzyme n=1 Tax=Saccharibacillus sp. CPCC 101409 TaxID=3058041 RepID=UPI0026730858|nr:NAD-dependent malic enzyme [Saccharibacillus sp. CPCC 101409]MDO3408243.1 NAD-dependent malic enzyme [Saccharibacillus sp. CPCC 101409]
MALGTSITIRLEMDKTRVTFGEVAAAIGEGGGDVVAIDVIHASADSTIRDLTINLPESAREAVLKAVGELPGTRIVNVSDRTFLAHLGGKIEIRAKTPVKNREDLSHVYTPGVAKVCMAIHEDPQKAFTLTIKRNTIAVVSDGTAVLGLGDIGPKAAMPVMEGKAMLFKQFAGVDAFPICLDTKDPEEIIRAVKQIAPAFGGINLEDISSPRCFEIERRLAEELDIPVFHDDQHGTAVVVLAGLLNALRIVGKSLEDAKLVVLGVGAAGAACIKMLLAAGAKNLIAVDRCGALHRAEKYDNEMWEWIAGNCNPNGEKGELGDVIAGADVFVGVSRPGLLTVEHIKSMAPDPIVFAMANPDPEIDPELAEKHVRVMATGRSDFPNQINNVLCFPGMFRGALDCRARVINEEMKVAAAQAIASVVEDDELNEQYIIPSVFNDKVVDRIRQGVVEAALRTGVARRTPPDFR